MTGKDSKQQKKVQPPPLIINDSHKADIGNITNTITTTTSSTANVDVANDSNIDTRNSGGSSVLEDFENKLTLNEKKMLSSSSSSSSLSTLTSKTTTANGSNTNTNLGTGSINTSHVTDIDTLTEKEWHNATYMKSQILTLSLLGEGAGGSVTKCKLKNGNKVFALKTISNNTKNNRGKNSGNSYGTSTETNVGNSRLQNNSKDIEDDLDVETKQILRELRFNMKCSSSPHIVTMYGMFYDSSLIYIAMEYMGGKSLDAIYNNLQMKGGRIGEKVLGKIAESVLRGLSYLHERKIIHRDIKPSNILMNLQGEVKLCDFGVSGEAVNSLATTFTGTSFYMAPERIQGQPYSVTSDVWSLGLTILEVAEGHFPLFSAIDGNNDGNNIDIDLPPIELLMMIINFKPELKDEPEYGLVWSKSFKNFVNYCLKKNPQDRPSPRQMLNHPWIQGQMKKKVNMAKFIKTCWQDD
ncbi:related to MAP kinase kinase MKK2/SSP33 [Saccharomycodes ludwigii]|uniref:mitogen-activated protein kinase kinase n=2 Tax=Saccharomycodes ludwigii TaxID=36035 RepID=A0A376B8F1_9ASCO|nr:related to MAP kinase kinase MKK2/SSP33 [Saccharomycodes ludwigii]